MPGEFTPVYSPPPPPPPPPPRAPEKGNAFIGLAWSFGVPVAFVGLMLGPGETLLQSSDVFLGLTLFVGIIQLVWLLPLGIYYHRIGHKWTLIGMWIGAGASFILSSFCGTIWWSFAHAYR